MVRREGFQLRPCVSPPVSHLDRQTGSLVLQVHHSYRHRSNGAQDTRQRCSLSREQLAEHWREPTEACSGRILAATSSALLGTSLLQGGQCRGAGPETCSQPHPSWGRGGRLPHYLKLERH